MEKQNILNFYKRRRLGKREQIAFSRTMSELHKNNSKLANNCLICGKECSSFCDSHSIPKFVLKSITNDGKVLTGTSFMSPINLKPVGVNSALVFSCVCHDCDSKYFQDYEHISKISSEFSNVAINEIAMKNYLRYAFKQHQNQQVFKQLLEMPNISIEEKYSLENQSFLKKKDVDEAVAKIIKYSKKKDDKNFYIIDELNLNYKTQLAYQGFITMVWGFDRLINNTFNYDDDYKIQQLGVCVFPFETGTKILLFCEEGSNRLRDFYKKYRKLSLEEKLYVINFIILLYEEDWVVEADFDEKELNKETLLLINKSSIVENFTNTFPGSPTESPTISIDLLKANYELKTSGDIYNFLSPKDSAG